MGISADTMRLLSEASEWLGLPFHRLSIGELGDQELMSLNRLPAKVMLEGLGAKHVSFDLNGKAGAIPLDLSKPLPEEWHGRFDLVTNYGTSEHVAVDDFAGQYQCWENMFLLMADRAVLILALPYRPGLDHGTLPTWTYERDFYRRLGDITGCLLLRETDSTICRAHWAAILGRAHKTPFPPIPAFKRRLGYFIADSQGRRYDVP